jgi:hypothetical protein
MKKLYSADSEYKDVVNDCQSILYMAERNFPDHVFKNESWIFLGTYLHRTYFVDGISFHVLLSEFLKLKQQRDYYLVPFWGDMDIIPELPIVSFSIEDTVSTYDEFWEGEADSRIGPTGQGSYLDLPDVTFILNEHLDWLYFQDRYTNMSIFAVQSNQDIDNLKQAFSILKEFPFCSSEDVASEVEWSMYNENGKRAFNQWIKPRIMYLTEDGLN